MLSHHCQLQEVLFSELQCITCLCTHISSSKRRMDELIYDIYIFDKGKTVLIIRKIQIILFYNINSVNGITKDKPTFISVEFIIVHTSKLCYVYYNEVSNYDMLLMDSK